MDIEEDDVPPPPHADDRPFSLSPSPVPDKVNWVSLIKLYILLQIMHKIPIKYYLYYAQDSNKALSG